MSGLWWCKSQTSCHAYLPYIYPDQALHICVFLFVNSCIICFFLLVCCISCRIYIYFFTFIIMLCLINRQGYLFQYNLLYIGINSFCNNTISYRYVWALLKIWENSFDVTLHYQTIYGWSYKLFLPLSYTPGHAKNQAIPCSKFNVMSSYIGILITYLFTIAIVIIHYVDIN